MIIFTHVIFDWCMTPYDMGAQNNVFGLLYVYISFKHTLVFGGVESENTKN